MTASPLYSQVKQFSPGPGVYLMKNSDGEILYVGKAKNLRSRVLNYFSQTGDGRSQIPFLMRKVVSVEPVLTDTEKEALLLENALIKKHQPRYNLFLKDDKTYLSLKLSLTHAFPRLTVTRQIKKDGSVYFGPYTSGFKAREVAEFIQTHFRLRTCADHEFANRVRPCLEYQIKRCDAPCVGLISKEAYGEWVQQAKSFLKGKNSELLKRLKQQMHEASENLDFERAARFRDLISAIQVTLEKQEVVSHLSKDFDVYGFVREEERVSLTILKSRGGVISETKTHLFKTHQDDFDFLENFLLQYYSESQEIPREILLPFSLEGLKALEEILSERAMHSVRLKIPEKGEAKGKVEWANKNALEHLKQQVSRAKNKEEVLLEIQQALGLSRLPRHMECYDISNLHGGVAVGSCVCFVDGLPEKKFYRHFKIKTVLQANDFAMLYEVLTRRVQHADWPLPDLIVIDGGKGQLASAQAALRDQNISIEMISLAKEKHGKPERIFLPGRKNPFFFLPHSSALHLLMHLRDEAHRFAITFHRKLRSKKVFE